MGVGEGGVARTGLRERGWLDVLGYADVVKPCSSESEENRGSWVIRGSSMETRYLEVKVRKRRKRRATMKVSCQRSTWLGVRYGQGLSRHQQERCC